MPDAVITTTPKGWPLLDSKNFIDVTPEYTKQLANKLENGDARVAEAINAASEAKEAAAMLKGGGIWREYTPKIMTGTSTVAIGNGTLRGGYCQIGSTVFANIYFNRGSSTYIGNGMYTFSLPIPANSTYLPLGIGRCTNGNKLVYVMATAADHVSFFDANLNAITTTNPGNWGSNQTIAGSFTYEAKP